MKRNSLEMSTCRTTPVRACDRPGTCSAALSDNSARQVVAEYIQLTYVVPRPTATALCYCLGYCFGSVP